MALVLVDKDTYIDTDELEQPEYYYYCKVKRIKPNSMLGIAILKGKLTAHDIETDEHYAWLSDQEVSIGTVSPKKRADKKMTGCDGVKFVTYKHDDNYYKSMYETLANLPSLKTLKAMNTKNKARAAVEVTFGGPVKEVYVRDVRTVWLYGEAFAKEGNGRYHGSGPLEHKLWECIYGHAYYSIYEGETYGYITNMSMISEKVLEDIRIEYRAKLGK